MPENTVIDGEVVALDEPGRPNFNLLQNFRSAASRMHYFVFDLLVCKGRDLTSLRLVERREVLRSAFKFASHRIRMVDYVIASTYGLRLLLLANVLRKSFPRTKRKITHASKHRCRSQSCQHRIWHERGLKISAEDIVFKREVTVPAAAHPMISYLDQNARRNQSASKRKT